MRKLSERDLRTVHRLAKRWRFSREQEARFVAWLETFRELERRRWFRAAETGLEYSPSEDEP